MEIFEMISQRMRF